MTGRVDQLAARLSAQLRAILGARGFRYEFDRVEGEGAVDRLARVVLDGSFVLEHRSDGRIDLERRGPLQPRQASVVVESRTRHRIEDAPEAWRLRVLRETGELLAAAVLHAKRTAVEGPAVDEVLDEAEAAIAALEEGSES